METILGPTLDHQRETLTNQIDSVLHNLIEQFQVEACQTRAYIYVPDNPSNNIIHPKYSCNLLGCADAQLKFEIGKGFPGYVWQVQQQIHIPIGARDRLPLVEKYQLTLAQARTIIDVAKVQTIVYTPIVTESVPKITIGVLGIDGSIPFTRFLINRVEKLDRAAEAAVVLREILLGLEKLEVL